MEEVLIRIKETFRRNENRVKAIQMEAYMRDQFKFLGIQSKERSYLLRPIWVDHKEEIKSNWKELIEQLWSFEHREFQMVAMELMKKFQKIIVIQDLDFLIHLVRSKSWWDTVDFLASNPIGYVVMCNRDKQKALVEEWIKDEDFWIQRVALIHQLKYKMNVDLELLFYCVKQVKDSKEFFLRKGAGWALREASKKYPLEIKDFVHQHPELSSLTKREALKYV